MHKLKEKNRIISVTQKWNKLRNLKYKYICTTTHVSTTMRTYLRCFGTKYSPLNGITQTEVALADKGLKNQKKKLNQNENNFQVEINRKIKIEI